MARLIKKHFMILLLMALAGCSNHKIQDSTTESAESIAKSNTTKQGGRMMLEEIYAIKILGISDQIDVHKIILKYIPIGTERSDVISNLKAMHVPEIHEKHNNMIYAEHRIGKPMLTPNARRIMMNFFFNEENKLEKVEALYLRLQ